MITRFQKTTHYLLANLCLLAAMLSNTNKYFVLSIQFPLRKDANTEMYEAFNKLRNYQLIYANFIHEYGVNFHELYLIPTSKPLLVNYRKNHQ